MKLTNEKLAEALGYTYKQFPIYYGGYSKRTGWYLGKNFKFENLPNFIRSLDKLVLECRRKGINPIDLNIPEHLLWDSASVAHYLYFYIKNYKIVKIIK